MKKKRNKESNQWLITSVIEVSDKDGIQSNALDLAKQRESELQEKTTNVLKANTADAICIKFSSLLLFHIKQWL